MIYWVVSANKTVTTYLSILNVVIYSDGGDRTVLIIVGTILACVAVSGVTTIVVLFVRVRRLTATVNAMTATGTKTGTY